MTRRISLVREALLSDPELRARLRESTVSLLRHASPAQELPVKAADVTGTLSVVRAPFPAGFRMWPPVHNFF